MHADKRDLEDPFDILLARNTEEHYGVDGGRDVKPVAQFRDDSDMLGDDVQLVTSQESLPSFVNLTRSFTPLSVVVVWRSAIHKLMLTPKQWLL